MTLRFRGKSGRFERRDARKRQTIEFWQKGQKIKQGTTRRWREDSSQRFRQRSARQIKRPIRKIKRPKRPSRANQIARRETIRQHPKIRITSGSPRAKVSFKLLSTAKKSSVVKVTIRSTTKRYTKTFTVNVKNENLSEAEREILATF